jgi:WD40 repeat protein
MIHHLVGKGQPNKAVLCLFMCLRFLLVDWLAERSFRGHRASVNSISFSPNMRMISSCADDGTIIISYQQKAATATIFVDN